jgi:hypothetical protein
MAATPLFHHMQGLHIREFDSNEEFGANIHTFQKWTNHRYDSYVSEFTLNKRGTEADPTRRHQHGDVLGDHPVPPDTQPAKLCALPHLNRWWKGKDP